MSALSFELGCWGIRKLAESLACASCCACLVCDGAGEDVEDGDSAGDDDDDEEADDKHENDWDIELDGTCGSVAGNDSSSRIRC